jgi:hypothetical protein
LLFATFATLFFVPVVFSIAHGKAARTSETTPHSERQAHSHT